MLLKKISKIFLLFYFEILSQRTFFQKIYVPHFFNQNLVQHKISCKFSLISKRYEKKI